MKTFKQLFEAVKWKVHNGNTFYHYGSGKGIAGTWGAANKEQYAHFGGKAKEFEFSFNQPQVEVDATNFDPVVSEALYHDVVTPEYEKDYAHFEELDMVDLFMDLVVAIKVKEKKRSGIIYKLGNNWENQIAQNLENHSLAELKKNYKKAYDGKISY